MLFGKEKYLDGTLFIMFQFVVRIAIVVIFLLRYNLSWMLQHEVSRSRAGAGQVRLHSGPASAHNRTFLQLHMMNDSFMV